MIVQVLFTHSEKIGSKLICWGTGELYSHVALFFPEIELVVHSTGSRGVHATSLPIFLKNNEVLLRIELTEQGKGPWQSFLHQISLPYDYLMILKLGTEILIKKLTNNKCNLRMSDKHARICTEFVSMCIFNSEQGLTPGELSVVLLNEKLGTIIEEPLV